MIAVAKSFAILIRILEKFCTNFIIVYLQNSAEYVYTYFFSEIHFSMVKTLTRLYLQILPYCKSSICFHFVVHFLIFQIELGCISFLAVYTHTVSFVWFLSGLEWILNLEFCLLKLLIFYQNLLWNIRSRLDSTTFCVFEPVLKYVWSKSSFFVIKASILIKHI